MYLLLGLFALLGVPAVLWLSSLGTRVAVARRLNVRGIGRLGLSYSAEYSAVPLRKRAAIQVSGHLTSYLICVAVLLVGAMGAGRAVATLEVRVLPGPAMDAGMRDGDVVIAIAGTRIAAWEELPATLSKHGGTPVTVEVDRAGEPMRFTVTPTNEGRIHVSPTISMEPASFGESLRLAAWEPIAHGPGIIVGMARAAASPRQELSGPVAMASGAPQRRSGWNSLLLVGSMMTLVWPVLTLIDLLLTWSLVRNARKRGRPIPA